MGGQTKYQKNTLLSLFSFFLDVVDDFFLRQKNAVNIHVERMSMGAKTLRGGGGSKNIVKSYEGDHFSEITFKGGISYILPC